MSILITCSSCNKRLRVPDHAAGKRVQCPECGHIFLVESADDVVEELQVEDRIVEKPSAPARRRVARDEAEEPLKETRRKPRRTEGKATAPRRKRPRDEEADDVVEEVTDDEDTPRPRKKTKRRKKKRTLALPFEEQEKPAWPWWVFGGGGICLVMFALLLTAVFANSGTLLKLLAIYMLIMMPISTIIFFVAMYLSSVLLGAMEIGEIHVALVKAFALIFVVDLVSWFPFGNYIAFGIWLIGLMVLFRLDLWEARMLLGINWILNFAVGFFLVIAIVGGAARAGKRDRDFDRFDDGRPGRVNEWDEEDAKDRGLR